MSGPAWPHPTSYASVLGTAGQIQFHALFRAHSQGILGAWLCEALGAWLNLMQLLQSGAPEGLLPVADGTKLGRESLLGKWVKLDLGSGQDRGVKREERD